MNENRVLDEGRYDPDRHEVRRSIREMLFGFRQNRIHRATVFVPLADALMGLLPGNPYRSPVDAWSLESDLTLLRPLQERVNFMVQQYEKALARAAEERKARSG